MSRCTTRHLFGQQFSALADSGAPGEPDARFVRGSASHCRFVFCCSARSAARTPAHRLLLPPQRRERSPWLHRGSWPIRSLPCTPLGLPMRSGYVACSLFMRVAFDKLRLTHASRRGCPPELLAIMWRISACTRWLVCVIASSFLLCSTSVHSCHFCRKRVQAGFSDSVYIGLAL